VVPLSQAEAPRWRLCSRRGDDRFVLDRRRRRRRRDVLDDLRIAGPERLEWLIASV
jgi:hypothetical protein